RQPIRVLLVAIAALFLLGSAAAHASLQNTSRALPTLSELIKLADQGDTLAQLALGIKYSNGDGVPQDYAEAMNWFRKAADQGEPLAELKVGVMYEKGQSVFQDYAEAMKWYRKAADQGDTAAEFIVGLNYTRGKAIPRDYVQAYMWLDLVAVGAS